MTPKFRNLKKDEIEVRVGAGKSLLLYKTARVDANILDETVGPYCWQKRFYQVKNTMICSVGIVDPETHEWIWKDDAGDDDYTMEKVKAEASDSFKRAAFAWGIGRSLYTAPKIKIPDQFKDCQYFDVEEIEYDSKDRISKLVISTNFGKDIVFSYPRNKNVSKTSEKTPKNDNVVTESKYTIAQTDLDYIQTRIANFQNEEKRLGFYDWLDENFGVSNPEALSLSQGQKVVAMLKGK